MNLKLWMLSIALLLVRGALFASESAYVSNYLSENVSVINLATAKGSATIPIGEYATAVALTPDGEFAYVGDELGTVSIIDTKTNQIHKTIKVSDGVMAIAISQDGKSAYTTNNHSNTISIIDTRSGDVCATIGVERDPRGIAITPDNKSIYVANCGSNSVSVIDAETHEISKITVEKEPIGVAVTPDGKFVYVANSGSKSVSVINTTTRSPDKTIPIEADAPTSIAIQSDGSIAFIGAGYFTTGIVIALDLTTHEVCDRIEVGDGPLALALTPDDKYVYAASFVHAQVSVIDNTVHPRIISAAIDVGTGPKGIAIQR